MTVDRALESYKSLQACIDMIPAPILLMHDSKKSQNSKNPAIPNQKLLVLLTGSDQINPLIVKELMR